MANLVYNTENKRVATADSKGATVIPTEDTENKRISIIESGGTTPEPVKIIVDEEGYASIEGRELTQDFIDPKTLGLTVDEDGYISIPE